MNERTYTRYEHDLLQVVQEAEKTAILLRQYAAAALRPARWGTSDEAIPTIAASVEISPEEWLVVSLPVMLPRREERDRARFLEEPLRTAIMEYLRDKSALRFRTCVMIYEHIYAASSRKRVTDHDNLELKHCQDVLEAAFLTNDSAALCSVFQCSHWGETDSTKIWVLSPEQFPCWLKNHADCWQTAPKK